MKIEVFNVAPSIPAELAFLETLARNLWWCWHSDAIELFRRINPQLWRDVGHNPLTFLSRVPQKRLELLCKDESFLRHLQRVKDAFEADMALADPARRTRTCIAYFSLEYGIHESIKVYAGGLGVLAGDHVKSASDMGLPMVAIGLLYRQGYFQQYLSQDGWQQEHYPENEMHFQPLRKALDANNQHVHVSVRLPEGVVNAAVWRLDVGRVPFYLLDANIPENPAALQSITMQLYGGDHHMRIHQELLLGIGGYRALLALGYEPQVCHINEGHAAFLNLARIEHLMKHKGIDLDTAMEIVPRSNVFTTHTPVPAGNECFHLDVLKPHLDALKDDVGISPETVISWGQPDDGRNRHELSMTVFGLRMAHFTNGVSRLHGEVARKMWSYLWTARPEDEVPIRHITNGIHVPSWLSPDNATLFDRYLGPSWHQNPSAREMLTNIGQIPDEELWRAHELGRSRLIRAARELLEKQLRVRNGTRAEISQAKSVLDHDALTIGFARRFATYKRATLLLKDPERLAALLNNDERPVQLIFAGKAHPADNHGKDFIRQIIQFTRKAELRRHIIFLENYDLQVARRLVQGVDIWLNTPRRPMEASGTSGMKVCVNGGIHLSVLDGWWDEGYNRNCGWAIGAGEEYADADYQDAVEGQALYNLLENEVIPCFYDRPQGDLPHAWINMMKASIKMAMESFTSHRMVSEYYTRFYKPAMANYDRLLQESASAAKALVQQRRRLKALWQQVHTTRAVSDRDISVLHVGDRFSVTCSVHLGELKPSEVDVEVYYGPVDSHNRITESHVDTMQMVQEKGHGHYVYSHEIQCRKTGRYGFTTRVTPQGAEWKHVMPGFVTWADGV
jgi:starch phosphorylase